MDQEQAFLNAIRRWPGSSAHRLVYADWLMDRGNPRGEFIQYQVRARRLTRDSSRRLDLEAKAHDLLLAHEANWLGPLLGVVGNWQWHDGLLAWVTVPAKVFLAQARHWLPALPLLGVHLRRARPHIADLARCEQLAHLSGLYLGDNDLTDDDLDVLLRSPHLRQVRSLFLQNNKLGPEGMRLLAETQSLPRLRELCLGHNRLGDQGIVQLAASRRLNGLRSLNVSFTLMDEAGWQALAGSRLLSRLRVLMASLNQLPPGCLATLVRTPACAPLRVLGYDLNLPDDADLVALARSPHVAGLRRLSLEAHRGVGDEGLRALASSPHLGQLRSLVVGPGTWGAASARALGRSRTLPRLRALRLTPGADDRAVLAALLGQPLVRRLHHLDLRVVQFDEDALAALASHGRPLRLRSLDVPLSPALAAAWKALLASGVLARLTGLTLTDPPAGCLRALLKPGRLPALRLLTVRGLPSLSEFQALLDSPLLVRLHELRIDLSYATEEQQGLEVVRRLCAAWNTPSLRRLSLLWSLSLESVRHLAEAPPPPALTVLELGSFRMGAEGIAALAGSLLLRQLRHLVLMNSSAQMVPGLEALMESPQVEPLLRVDIQNGQAPRELVPAIRRRFGLRFAVSGRKWPQTISVGGWDHVTGALAD